MWDRLWRNIEGGGALVSV